MYKSNGWLVWGEWSDAPTTYDDRSCVFCTHFTSYGSEYETDYEPADCGVCSVRLRDSVDCCVSYEDTCDEFALSDFYKYRRDKSLKVHNE